MALKQKGDIMPESVIINEIIQLKKDALVMALRLMGEKDETFSPECYEVMKRWEPIALKACADACKY